MLIGKSLIVKSAGRGAQGAGVETAGIRGDPSREARRKTTRKTSRVDSLFQACSCRKRLVLLMAGRRRFPLLPREEMLVAVLIRLNLTAFVPLRLRRFNGALSDESFAQSRRRCMVPCLLRAYSLSELNRGRRDRCRARRCFRRVRWATAMWTRDPGGGRVEGLETPSIRCSK